MHTLTSEASQSPRPYTANFDPVARLYRWCEYLLLGPLLARTRRHFLPLVAPSRRALVLGDGDGRFLAALLQRSPHLTAVAVDGSAGMLHLLERHCRPHAMRLNTLQADIRDLALEDLGPAPDLVVTHFFLDCLSTDDVTVLARRLHRHLPPGSLWLVSDFAVPAHQPWRFLGRALIAGLYRAFGLLTGLRIRSLPRIAPVLFAAGFRCIHHASWCKGLLYSEVWRAQAGDARPGNPTGRNSQGPASHPFALDGHEKEYE